MSEEKQIDRKPRERHPWDTMEVGGWFDAGEYSFELHRAMGALSSYYEKKHKRKGEERQYRTEKQDGKLIVFRIK